MNSATRCIHLLFIGTSRYVKLKHTYIYAANILLLFKRRELPVHGRKQRSVAVGPLNIRLRV